MVQRLTPCPTPVPSRANPTDFDPNADNVMDWFPTMSTEYNVGAGQIETANEACVAAQTACQLYRQIASAAANATEYSAVATYDFPDVVVTTTGDFYTCIGTSVSGVNPVTDGGANWKLLSFPGSGLWITKTAAYTLEDYDRVFADTTSASFTLTLPSTPVAGASRVWVSDIGETFSDTNFITMARNGNKIMNLAEDMTAKYPGSAFSLLYVSAAYGWKLVHVT